MHIFRDVVRHRETSELVFQDYKNKWQNQDLTSGCLPSLNNEATLPHGKSIYIIHLQWH